MHVCACTCVLVCLIDLAATSQAIRTENKAAGHTGGKTFTEWVLGYLYPPKTEVSLIPVLLEPSELRLT